jgi:hypothetical protein
MFDGEEVNCRSLDNETLLNGTDLGLTPHFVLPPAVRSGEQKTKRPGAVYPSVEMPAQLNVSP